MTQNDGMSYQRYLILTHLTGGIWTDYPRVTSLPGEPISLVIVMTVIGTAVFEWLPACNLSPTSTYRAGHRDRRRPPGGLCAIIRANEQNGGPGRADQGKCGEIVTERFALEIGHHERRPDVHERGRNGAAACPASGDAW